MALKKTAADKLPKIMIPAAAVTIRPTDPEAQPPQADAADAGDGMYPRIFGAPEPVTIRHPE